MSRPKSITSASLKVYDTDLNLEWVRPYLPLESEKDKAEAKILAMPLNGAGGVLCSLYSISVGVIGQPELNLIYKTTQPTEEAESASKNIGQAREALFYAHIAPDLLSEVGLPRVYASRGDMVTGVKEILMDDLSETGIQSGLLFGPLAPINMGRNVNSIINDVFESLDAIVPSPEQVAMATVTELAKLHRKYWCSSDFVK